MEKRKNEIIANRLMIDFLIVILAVSVLLFLMRGFSSNAASITRKIVIGMSVLSLIGCVVSEYYIKKRKLLIRWDMMFGFVFIGCVFLVFPGANTTAMLYFLLGAVPAGFVLIILYYTVFINYIRDFRVKR